MSSSGKPQPLLSTQGSTTTYHDWVAWKRELEYYLEAKEITDPARKKAVLLHRGGRGLQEVYATLEPAGQAGSGSRKSTAVSDKTDESEKSDKVVAKPYPYKTTIELLDKHFKPTTSRCYERFLFRQIKQGSDTIDQFIVRLRTQAVNCKFAAPDEAIADQIIDGCADPVLRHKVLEQKLEKLQAIIDLGKLLEVVSVQTKAMESGVSEAASSVGSDVARLSSKTPARNTDQRSSQRSTDAEPPKSSSNRRCSRCGSWKHDSSDEACPARTSTCHKCGKEGHWSNKCRSRQQVRRTNDRASPSRLRRSPSPSPARGKGSSKVRALRKRDDDERSWSSGDSYTFQLRASQSNASSEYSNRVQLAFGSVCLNPVIDSGSDVNLIDPATWKRLVREKVPFTQAAIDSKVYPYGRKTSLKFEKAVVIRVKSESRSVEGKFFVLTEDEGDYETIVGRVLAVQLGVLHIGSHPARVRHICVDQPDGSPRSGKLIGVQLDIPLDPSVKPVIQPNRRVPYAVRKKVSHRLRDLCNDDIIEKVVDEPTDWVSPIVPVIKQNGDLRLCIDMRQANRAVLRERYPIPTFEEIIPEMTDCKFFSRVDLKDAYHQVELTPGSRRITTFITPDGVYRFKRLYCGIRCAPEMFQRLMTQVLAGLDNVQVFFDDIIIYSRTKADHEKHVKAVLDRLRERGLTINLDKSTFGASKISFLGHSLSKNSIQPKDSNIASIKNFKAPQNKKDVQSFLGLMNFVARFVPEFSTVTEPLRQLLKKNVAFKWSDAQQKAFDTLKKSIEGAKLSVLDPEAKIQIFADASPYGLGAVLLQQRPGKSSPEVLGFASRSLSPAEQNYSQIEREALGLVWACERFRFYTLGKQFVLYTDHKPLEVLFSPRSKPNARIERWLLRLQNFDYQIRYIEGHRNIADSLSRLGCPYPSAQSYAGSVKSTIYHITRLAVPKAITLEEFRAESEADAEIAELRLAIVENAPLPPEYLRVKYELAVVDNMVLRGDRLIPPRSLRDQILLQAHEGHPGIDTMKKRLRTKVWWPQVDKDAESAVKSCMSCLAVSKHNPPEKLTSSMLPRSPWEFVAIDYLGPLPDNRYILVVVDYFSRFIECYFTTSTSAATTISCLLRSFARFGVPSRLKSDNARAFTGGEFTEFLSEYKVCHVTSPPLWPQANGEVERQNRTILKRLQIAALEQRSLENELSKFLLLYHGTPHSTTSVPPAELMLARRIRDKLPSISTPSPYYDSVRDIDAANKERGKVYADRRRNAAHRTIEIGDQVLLPAPKLNKLSPAFDPVPYTVTESSPGEVIVTRGGRTFRRSSSAVKLIPQSRPAFEVEPGEPDAQPMPTQLEIQESQPASKSYAESVLSSPGWKGWATEPGPVLPAAASKSPASIQTRSGRTVKAPSRLSY